MKSEASAILVSAFACLFAGCTTPTHLVFEQSATVGASIASNTTTGKVDFAIGYLRETNTLIPKTQTSESEGAPPENEAMAVVSASEVKIKGLGLHAVTEQFATGKAARNLAQDPNAVGQIVSLTVPKDTAKP